MTPRTASGGSARRRVERYRIVSLEVTPAASIVIVTKDRRREARRAIESALAQQGEIEVIVMDDGSTDGTAAMIDSEFPQVVLQRSATSHGSVEQRNRAARLAKAPILVSLDDDAVFDDPTVTIRTLEEFTQQRIAAVQMPPPQVTRPGRRAVAAFVGWAHAIRRKDFLMAGGYQQSLISHGEERDLCIRLLERGRIVVQGQVGGVSHYPSPTRNWPRAARLARRNDIRHAWQNVPLPEAIPHVVASIVKGVWIGVRYGALRDQLIGLCAGLRQCTGARWKRHPVSRRTYRLYRRLGRPGGLPLAAALKRAEPNFRRPHSDRTDEVIDASAG